MDFIFDIALKMGSFPCIAVIIAALAFLSLELLTNKMSRGGF